MKTSLHELLKSRPLPERVALVVVSAILGALLYLWLLKSASLARSQLRSNIPLLKAQAARFEQEAVEYSRLRNAPPATVSKTDIRLLIQAQVEAAGLSQTLKHVDATDANQAQVTFENVPFAAWLVWIGSLQAQHIHLDTCRIEASSQAGLVKVTATLVRPVSL